MDSDFSGGTPPRRKPKIINPIDKPKKPSIHELAAREGHDLNAVNDAAGPEAGVAMGFVGKQQDKDKATRSVRGRAVEATGGPGGRNKGESPSQDPASKTGLKAKFDWMLKYQLTKKQKIIALVVAAVLIVVSGVSVLIINSHNNVPPLTYTKAVPKPKPKPIYSPLTGLPVTKRQAEMPVTGVMIENSLPARPQSGLSQAGVVYEAIAEAGITRFLALFQGENPSNIGPIRSARPYFIRWDLGYDASYAHVGGSPEALSDIKEWGVKDLDQYYAGDYYHRVNSRWAPHNMYTNLQKLHQLEKARGTYEPSDFTGFERKKDEPAKKPTAATIAMAISSSAYDVKYKYLSKSNSYERSEGGILHVDANTNKAIAPKVVVALIIPYSLESDGYHSNYKNIGSGPAYIFQDGQVIQGKWGKADLKAPLKLTDESGASIPLNRGQTWLTALANSSELTYNP